MNLGTLRCTDEVKQAVAMAQQYANWGYTPEALITTLGKIACRDNFTEMHAYKHHQETYEEFYATRPSLRWHHLVAAVQAAARRASASALAAASRLACSSAS